MSHPNFGWPGQPAPAPFGYPQPGFVPQPGVPLAPPAQAQPAPAPQPAQQPQAPAFSMDTVIPRGDPNWPQELWGKPVREAMRIYNIMKEDFLRRNTAQPQPQNPPAPQPQFQQPQPQQPRQPAPQQPQALDPNNLQEMISAAVRNSLNSSPMAAVSAEMVMGQVRMRFPDWNQYHMQILQEVSGAPTDQMLNPGLWESAYYLVKGRAMSQGQTPVYQPQYDNGNGGYSNGHRDPTGAIRTPPPVFTEQPQTPNTPTTPIASLTNDPRIINMARRFGIPVEQYAQSYAEQMGLNR